MQSTVQLGEVLLGKYRVERVLGQGGMGVVIAARHVHLGELFAIKMLLPTALSHHDAVERFLREARSAAKLKGEHVAHVHDVGCLENGMPYMVMEHLAGNDLKHVVKGRGALPLDEAALYVYQACEAVAEAHANGIVHRDLKPANLFLIRRPNGTPCVKVLDFGISKELNPTNHVGSDLTKTGAFMGSPLYMSPEQMANIKATDKRGDIWALGVILYELTTGKVPFVAEAMTELVTRVLTATPLPPSHVRPDIPLAFDAIVLRCLEKRPDHRFQSVHELMAQLLPYTRSSGPLDTRGSSPLTQPVVSSHPEMVFSPTTVVMATMPIAGTNQAVPQSDSGRSSSTNGQVPEGKDRKALITVGAGIVLVALISMAFIATRPSAPVPASAAGLSVTTPPTIMLPATSSELAPPRKELAPATSRDLAKQEPLPQQIAEPTTAPTVSAVPAVTAPSAVTQLAPPIDATTAASAAPETTTGRSALSAVKKGTTKKGDTTKATDGDSLFDLKKTK